MLGRRRPYYANVKNALIGSLMLIMFWETMAVLRECKESTHRKFDCVRVLGNDGYT